MSSPPTLSTIAPEMQAIEHFTARAQHYDRSSRWCSDPQLMEWLVGLCSLRGEERMLDVACGTGLVSRAFRARVRTITGLDPTPAMASRALPFLDNFVEGFAENLAFADGEFDLTVCRQGLQFMEAASATREMARVTRRGGKVVLVNLCAYGGGDESEYFEILRLRNPARKNFFIPEDLRSLLVAATCREVELWQRPIEEAVEPWADNKAISVERCERIRHLYENASPRFRELHQLQSRQGLIVDRMLFAVAIGHR